MIKIQDVTVPGKGTGKYLNILADKFPISPTNGISISWLLLDEGVKDGEPYPSEVILQGTLAMTQETYDQWGTDDSYVIDWALTELGFTEVEP